MWLVFITELLAWNAALEFKNNLAVYAIYGFFEIALVSLYFNYSIKVFRKHNIGFYIASVVILMGILNTIFIQPLNTLNTNYIFLECLVVVSMSLFSIYRLIIEDKNNLKLSKEVHFWFPCIFILEWCGNFLSWGLYDYFQEEMKDSAYILNNSLYVVNIIVYLSFAAVIFFYPKMKPTYV